MVISVTVPSRCKTRSVWLPSHAPGWGVGSATGVGLAGSRGASSAVFPSPMAARGSSSSATLKTNPVAKGRPSAPHVRTFRKFIASIIQNSQERRKNL